MQDAYNHNKGQREELWEHQLSSFKNTGQANNCSTRGPVLWLQSELQCLPSPALWRALVWLTWYLWLCSWCSQVLSWGQIWQCCSHRREHNSLRCSHREECGSWQRLPAATAPDLAAPPQIFRRKGAALMWVSSSLRQTHQSTLLSLQVPSWAPPFQPQSLTGEEGKIVPLLFKGRPSLLILTELEESGMSRLGTWVARTKRCHQTKTCAEQYCPPCMYRFVWRTR